MSFLKTTAVIFHESGVILQVIIQDKKYYLTLSKACEIFKKSEAVIKSLKYRKKVRAPKWEGFTGKGKKPVIFSWDDLVDLYGDPGINIDRLMKADQKPKQQPVEEPEDKGPDYDELSKQLGLSADEATQFHSLENFSKVDVEKIIKLQQARDKILDLNIKTGKLIDYGEIETDIKGVLTELFAALTNQIDVWKFKYGFSLKQTEAMEADYDKMIKNSMKKILAKAKSEQANFINN